MSEIHYVGCCIVPQGWNLINGECLFIVDMRVREDHFSIYLTKRSDLSDVVPQLL